MAGCAEGCWEILCCIVCGKSYSFSLLIFFVVHDLFIPVWYLSREVDLDDDDDDDGDSINTIYTPNICVI